MMIELLKRAFARAQELPEEDQDHLGAWILEEIADDQAGSAPTAQGLDVLKGMAAETRTEDEAGLARPLEEVLDDYRHHGRFLAR